MKQPESPRQPVLLSVCKLQMAVQKSDPLFYKFPIKQNETFRLIKSIIRRRKKNEEHAYQ